MIRLDLRESVDRETWNARISALNGPVQMSTEWCQFCCARTGGQPIFVHGGGQDDVRSIVYLHRSARWPLSLWPAAGSDCLPLTSQPAEVMAGLEAQLRERGCVSYAVNSLAQTSIEPWPLASMGYAEKARVEFVVSMEQGLDHVFGRIRSELRSQIRRAGRAGVTFAVAQDRTVLAPLQRIEVETTQRHQAGGKGETGLRSNTFDLIWEHLVKTGRACIHLAMMDEEIVAYVVIGTMGSQAYYLYGGAAGAALSTHAPKALMWHAMQHAYESGVREFNLGGMGAEAADPRSPDHGLHQYKRGLGGQQRACLSGSKILRPQADQLQQRLHRVVAGLRGLRRQAGGEATPR